MLLSVTVKLAKQSILHAASGTHADLKKLNFSLIKIQFKKHSHLKLGMHNSLVKPTFQGVAWSSQAIRAIAQDSYLEIMHFNAEIDNKTGKLQTPKRRHALYLYFTEDTCLLTCIKQSTFPNFIAVLAYFKTHVPHTHTHYRCTDVMLLHFLNPIFANTTTTTTTTTLNMMTYILH